MIDFLRGKIVHIGTDHTVLDVHGIGYRVFTPNPYALQQKMNEEYTLFIHHHVREDAIFLFGFTTREEQALFRKLLDVSGIGPKVALGMLSGSSPEAMVTAIQQENVIFLTKLPGIGKKTAQRIILDLKDKLAFISTSNPHNQLEENSYYPTGEVSVWSEAKEALLSLGYKESEADRAWLTIKSKVQDSDSVDIVVKLALQALFTS